MSLGSLVEAIERALFNDDDRTVADILVSVEPTTELSMRLGQCLQIACTLGHNKYKCVQPLLAAHRAVQLENHTLTRMRLLERIRLSTELGRLLPHVRRLVDETLTRRRASTTAHL